MSNTPEPQRLDITRAALSRWMHQWWALTRRTPAPLAVLSLAMIAFNHSRVLPPIFSDLVTCVLLAVMLLFYARADHHTTLANVWDAFKRGTPGYFVVITAVYLTLILIAVIAIMALALLLSAISLVISLIFGSAPGGYATLDALAGMTVPDGSTMTGIWYLAASGVHGAALTAGATAPMGAMLTAGYIAYFFTSKLRPMTSLYWRFYRRNSELVGCTVMLALAGQVVGLICASSAIASLIVLPVALLWPAAFAGLTYIVAREAFMGQLRNAPQEQQASHAQAAPAPST